jgi:hypothetical protein
MTDEATSPLRQRMIEDMTIRKLTPKTQQDYVQRVKHFTAFLRRSPDTASFEDVRRYQLHLAASGAGESGHSQCSLACLKRATSGHSDGKTQGRPKKASARSKTKEGIVRRCTRSLVRQPELPEIVCNALHCGA